jgi:hypothetical protein
VGRGAGKGERAASKDRELLRRRRWGEVSTTACPPQRIAPPARRRASVAQSVEGLKTGRSFAQAMASRLAATV